MESPKETEEKVQKAPVDDAVKDRLALAEFARIIGELEVQNALLRIELMVLKKPKAQENGGA